MRSFLALALLLLPVPASAQVVVNEVAWMGTLVDGVDSRQEWRYEWIELANASESPVSLEGWSIEFARDETEFVILLHGAVEPGGYFLAGASSDIPGVDLNYANLGGKLSNEGMRVLLLASNGELADEVAALGGWFAGDNESKATMERRFPKRAASDSANWGTSLEPGGSPGGQNSVFGKEAAAGNFEQPKPPASQEGRAVLPPLFSSPAALGLLVALGSALLALAARLLLRP